MTLVYTSANGSLVHLAKNVLENSGIECHIRGEHLATAIGGIAPIDAWLELWVDELYAVTARDIIDELMATPETEDEAWICPDCIEWREAPFSHCWKCGAERLR